MPYFQRKPIEELVDAVRSMVAIPGLPSRGPAPANGVTAGAKLISPAAALTGIVEQASAVLASERPSRSAGSSTASGTGAVAPAQGTQISQLQQQVNALLEQLVTLVGRPLDSAAPQSTILAGLGPRSEAAQVIVEPAPVLSPAAPVAPGGTAQISISLVNEDEQPAQIVFLSTGLIGEAGEQIAAERISFKPRELVLSPGNTGEVIVHVVIPAQTRCGVYSGLIRASRLDYLHAVLVVLVE